MERTIFYSSLSYLLDILWKDDQAMLKDALMNAKHTRPIHVTPYSF